MRVVKSFCLFRNRKKEYESNLTQWQNSYVVPRVSQLFPIQFCSISNDFSFRRGFVEKMDVFPNCRIELLYQ